MLRKDRIIFYSTLPLAAASPPPHIGQRDLVHLAAQVPFSGKYGNYYNQLFFNPTKLFFQKVIFQLNQYNTSTAGVFYLSFICRHLLST